MADTLRIPCPMCQTMLKAPPEAAGKSVKCKHCGHKFTVGITAEQLAAKRPAAAPPAPPDPEPVTFDPEEEAAFGIVREPPPAAPAMGPTITYVCDQCGKYGQAPAHNAGMIFACGCGGVIRVPDLPVEPASRERSRLVQCPDCGAEVSRAAAACVKCGRPMQRGRAPAGSGPNRFLAGALAFFLGALGLHKFYMGYGKEGLIMHAIGVCTCGIGYFLMAFYGAVEGLSYWMMSDQDFHDTYVANRKGWL